MKLVLILLCSALFVTAHPQAVSAEHFLQDKVSAFELKSVDGKTINLRKTTDKRLTVIAFLGTECPLVQVYGTRLSELSKKYAAKNVHVIGLNSNRQDSIDDVKSFIASHKIAFPIGKDLKNKIADQFGATRTPEVVLLNSELDVLYRGRIDDQYSPGVTRSKVKQHFLRDAIDSAIAGKEITVNRTEAEGCLIGRVKESKQAGAKITFANQISRVLQAHCVECHRADEIGPFSLTEYEEVVGWGDMMVEVMDEGRMPPWHADPKHGRFSNSRNMPESDKQLIRDWVEQGMPLGDKTNLPPPRRFISGWRLPQEPDQVVAMRNRPFRVPADGTVEYQYFVVDPGFKEDRWITAAEVIPGNRSVVHHSIVFIRPPDVLDFRGTGWLAAFVPGQSPPEFDPSVARLVPAGSKFVFQQHYTPNGTAVDDITRVGLVFGKPEQINSEVLTLTAMNQDFTIPPGDDNFTVKFSLGRLPKSGTLLSAAPHMHYRGKSFSMVLDSGSTKNTVLEVPNYDFNWQHNYQFKEPHDLAQIKRIRCSITFDNSDGNPFNPNSREHVSWGDQTWEEMAVAFFDVKLPLGKDGKLAQLNFDPVVLFEDQEVRRIEKANARVEKAFARFDKNKDGLIVKNETPNSVKHFAFHRYDANDDGNVTKDELYEYAYRNSRR